MFQEFRKELEWGGRTLVLETGKIARQADGAVMVTYGDTKVLCTVVGEKSPRPGMDFFPLSVHYNEKAYAAGKIPGGYLKREGRPSDSETFPNRRMGVPEGWGLKHVLLAMTGRVTGTDQVLREFSESARFVLQRRIANNPRDRRWQRGWMRRVDTYRRPLP